MNTSFASIARLARQTRAVSLPLLVAGALAAGCGTVSADKVGGPYTPVGGSATASASAPKATPVPTVTGGTTATGASACLGWPSGAPHGKLTAFFQPVSVERCVTGYQQVKGKGEWRTATLEKSTDNLATLVNVLLQPSARTQPGVFCPEFAVIPPQVVLFNAAGKQLIPELPMGTCGTADARVLTTLATMTWQPVSVRLVSKIVPVSGTPRTLPGAKIGSVPVTPPKAIRTGGAAAAN
jgi:hypothetical protein